VRVVLDANVLVSALLSRSGTPARLLQLWLSGHFELVVCDALLAEVTETLAYPKIRKRVAAEVVPDPDEPPPASSPDPKDEYLLALAARERVPLVSGDSHLLGLGPALPILNPRQFLNEVEPG
jgi:uncharacterized protein